MLEKPDLPWPSPRAAGWLCSSVWPTRHRWKKARWAPLGKLLIYYERVGGEGCAVHLLVSDCNADIRSEVQLTDIFLVKGSKGTKSQFASDGKREREKGLESMLAS